MTRASLIIASLLMCLHGPLSAQDPDRLQKDGNFQEAFARFKSRLETSKSPSPSADLKNGIECLQSLGQLQDTDTFLEGTIKQYAEDWQVLASASALYASLPHYGALIDNTFVRGHYRGNGTYVNAQERDRLRSLQLTTQAMRQVPEDANASLLGTFYSDAADRIQNTRAAWQLQILTDFSSLGDFEEGRFSYSGHSSQGAPVDADGDPVFFKIPTSWDTALS